MTKEDPLIDVCLCWTCERAVNMASDQVAKVRGVVERFLSGQISFQQAASKFSALVGTTEPIERIADIISLVNSPAPDVYEDTTLDDGNSRRKKTRGWTTMEDMRLLAGIHKFGLDEWPNVAAFVGHGRTRNQCSQRWLRVLDPKISKDVWTKAETEKLFRLVEQYGTKSWMKIATEMGNRCDVQCRYQYMRHQKAKDYASSAGQSVAPEKLVPVADAKPLLPPMQAAVGAEMHAPLMHQLYDVRPVQPPVVRQIPPAPVPPPQPPSAFQRQLVQTLPSPLQIEKPKMLLPSISADYGGIPLVYAQAQSSSQISLVDSSMFLTE